MFKIEFGRKPDGDMVTVSKCPLDTVLEAEVFAIAKIRQRLSIVRLMLEHCLGSLYRVSLDGQDCGYCRITKM